MSTHFRKLKSCAALVGAILASASIAHADPSANFSFSEPGPDGDVGQFTLGLSKTGDGTYAVTSVSGSYTYDDGYGVQTSAYTGVEPGGVVYSPAGFVKYFDSNGVILDYTDARLGPSQAREAYDYDGQEQNGRYTAVGLNGTLVGVDPTTSADILFGWKTPDQVRHYGELEVALSQFAPDQYLPTGITGTFDSQVITGLNLHYQNPDSTIYDLQQYHDIFDGQGVSLAYGDGKVANLYIGADDKFFVADDAGTSSEASYDNYYHVTYGDTPYADINFNPGNYSHTPFSPSPSPSPSPAPEPSSWALMIIGFGGLGAAARRQRQASPRTSNVHRPI